MKPLRNAVYLFLLTFFSFFAGCEEMGKEDELSRYKNKEASVRFEREESLTEFLEKIKTYYKLPAIAAAVVSADSLLDIAAVGKCRAGGYKSVSTKDPFPVGTCTKSMTSFIAAILVEKGLLNWNTKPADIFTGFKDEINADYRAITLLDLLSHRAGIPSLPKSFYTGGTGDISYKGQKVKNREHLTCLLLKEDSPGKPGKFKYSREGYIIAAAMMEKATGKSWESIVNEYLFKPLDLISGRLDYPGENDSTAILGHNERNNAGLPVAGNPVDSRIHSLLTPTDKVRLSIEDLSKFTQLHLIGLNGYDTIISAETYRLLHSPAVTINDSEAYGLGWLYRKTADDIYSVRAGKADSFYSIIKISHNSGLACIVLTNIGDKQAEAACENVLNEVFAHNYAVITGDKTS